MSECVPNVLLRVYLSHNKGQNQIDAPMSILHSLSST
jgi:hypothetical protein